MFCLSLWLLWRFAWEKMLQLPATQPGRVLCGQTYANYEILPRNNCKCAFLSTRNKNPILIILQKYFYFTAFINGFRPETRRRIWKYFSLFVQTRRNLGIKKGHLRSREVSAVQIFSRSPEVTFWFWRVWTVGKKSSERHCDWSLGPVTKRWIFWWFEVVGLVMWSICWSVSGQFD